MPEETHYYALWEFNSQTFNKTEQNYPIYDRELLGMMRGLRTWRHLLQNTTHPGTRYHRPHQSTILPGTPETGTSRQWLPSGTSGISHSISLQTRRRPTSGTGLSRRPDLIPDNDDELIIVLPDHPVCSPRRTPKKRIWLQGQKLKTTTPMTPW